jgi:hypothetical protein
MVLDRPVRFQESDLNFSNTPPARPVAASAPPPDAARTQPLGNKRWPW